MNNKKTTVVTISATLALILLVATATFAYFQADLGNNKEVDVTVSTVPQTDLLSFSVGDPLALQADETSFVKGGDSVSDTTNVKALLTAGRNNTAIKYYYVYLLISGNEFIYSQDENTPELILTIKKPDGTELTTLDGLTYKTVTDGKGTTIKGFDITTKEGLITIVRNNKITTTSELEEQWDVTVTLVNYNANQINNINKNFTSKLIIQQDEYQMPTLASYVKSQYTGTQGDNNLYYHDSNFANGAGDNSYRYAGASASVNNYICLGSDATTCPDANLFRIIGVFGDQVKVIKANKITNKYWNEKESSTWSTSSLNTYLNGEYLTSLGTLANKITTTTWKVGGGSENNISKSVPSTVYKYEVGTSSSSTMVSKKIGLMYVSDYGFAASPSAWTTTLYNYNGNNADEISIPTINWLYLGSYEWTITPDPVCTKDTSSNVNMCMAYAIFSDGTVNEKFFGTVNYNNHGVRPAFYLNSSTSYNYGVGSLNKPIRIL